MSEVLFELPATLQKCLDRKAYGEAVEAYCSLVASSDAWTPLKGDRGVILG